MEEYRDWRQTSTHLLSVKVLLDVNLLVLTKETERWRNPAVCASHDVSIHLPWLHSTFPGTQTTFSKRFLSLFFHSCAQNKSPQGNTWEIKENSTSLPRWERAPFLFSSVGLSTQAGEPLNVCLSYCLFNSLKLYNRLVLRIWIQRQQRKWVLIWVYSSAKV